MSWSSKLTTTILRNALSNNVSHGLEMFRSAGYNVLLLDVTYWTTKGIREAG